ncbi:MAG: thioesterase family protein [Candidatus Korarchaeum sp.]|nr:thioesterase family protein [Candidatus Korarchaeum sp.]MDW8035368.1 thioesterase family protein [Candidatus Korarchaeum sp.]
MGLQAGVQVERKFRVTEEMLASIVGSGRVEVLSTPSMIALMESVAESLVADKLPEGMISVGTKVCVRHRSPAWLGDEIKVRAKLREVSGRRLVFEVECLRGDSVIGEGEHERYVVERERFSKGR